jgi:hypothetical protein
MAWYAIHLMKNATAEDVTRLKNELDEIEERDESGCMNAILDRCCEEFGWKQDNLIAGTGSPPQGVLDLIKKSGGLNTFAFDYKPEEPPTNLGNRETRPPV